MKITRQQLRNLINEARTAEGQTLEMILSKLSSGINQLKNGEVMDGMARLEAALALVEDALEAAES